MCVWLVTNHLFYDTFIYVRREDIDRVHHDGIRYNITPTQHEQSSIVVCPCVHQDIKKSSSSFLSNEERRYVLYDKYYLHNTVSVLCCLRLRKHYDMLIALRSDII